MGKRIDASEEGMREESGGILKMHRKYIIYTDENGLHNSV